MRLQRIHDFLRCPACHGDLEVDRPAELTSLQNGELKCSACARSWPVRDGIPQLVFPDELGEQDQRSQSLWNRVAILWPAMLALTNVIRGSREAAERQHLIERLDLREGQVALETACGDGNNLHLIARQVSDQGLAFGLDLSPRMLGHAARKLRGLPVPPKLVLGNVTNLPFADDAFDAALDGFGMKYYADRQRAMSEMLRVVKPGGKVVISELGRPTHGRKTLRQRLLGVWIPGFDEPPPLDAVPGVTEGLAVEWDAHETAYTIEFRKPATVGAIR